MSSRLGLSLSRARTSASRRALSASALSLALAPLLASCETPAPIREITVSGTRSWRSETFAGCVLASPLETTVAGVRSVIVASGDGRVALLDPDTGATRASLALPHEAGQIAHVIATPALVSAERLVVAYQEVLATASDPAAGPRSAHRVVVVDLATMALDPAFAPLTLEASVPAVLGSGAIDFLASNALSRSRLVHAPSSAGLGHVYVSFGNARDIQPWHGWVFEIDLEHWGTTPISAVLNTTPESDCGPAGAPGDREMVCGGGVWAPAGPLFVPAAEGREFELVIPTGNGHLDVDQGLYAHTLMRVRGPGLHFESGCDESLCAGFDVTDPSPECLSSCESLFVPRMLPGDPPFDAPACAGLSFFECYAALDWDLGANSALRVSLSDGHDVLVLPAKDGSVYLLDAEHLGTLYDRHEVNHACGYGMVRCDADWAGTMVTQPVVTTDTDGTPLVVIATFMPDEANDAGLVGLRVVSDASGPHLERAWEFPRFGTGEASQRFRKHPSGVALARVGGVEHAIVVEQGTRDATPGVLHVVRAHDGEEALSAELEGPGQRFSVPLVLAHGEDARVVAASCENGNSGPSHLEAWDLVAHTAD
ncbi:MAG: hypothetical protein U0353_14620 [Sandaracinus sp.]